VRLIHREETHRNRAEPLESIFLGQPLGRKIEKAIVAARRFLHHLSPFGSVLETVHGSGRNAHLGQLGSLVLHERDQRRNHDGGLSRHDGGKLITERLAASGWHHDAGIVPRQQAADDTFLPGAEFVVSPVAPERVE
jgi:hypothetical protein